MPKTVPNQKIFYIHRKMPDSNFLQISKENFFNAFKDLNSSATIIYLYLASNKDGYELAFSPQAVENQLGMPVSTTRDQVAKLIEKGYLVQLKPNSNIFNFYEKPHYKEELAEEASENCFRKTNSDFEWTDFDKVPLDFVTEINKNINK